MPSLQEETLHPKAKATWEQWKKANQPTNQGHDTVGLIVVDRNGDLCVGCATSGAKFKEVRYLIYKYLLWKPGRVGDSPIIGSGLYVDNDVGGASATGQGDGESGVTFVNMFQR